MKNLLAFIILFLISNINLKLEKENIDFFIELTTTDDCYIWNNNTIALRTNLTNPIAIFNSSEYESITFDIGLNLRYTDIIVNMECHLWKPKKDVCSLLLRMRLLRIRKNAVIHLLLHGRERKPERSTDAGLLKRSWLPYVH